MSVRAPALSRLPAVEVSVRLDARAIAAWAVGFAPVFYLALRGGGYDLIVRSEVGLVLWWILLLAVVSRALPLNGIGRLGWVCAGLLGAFALWSGIATAWSLSPERSVAEVSRLVSYLGFLVLGLCAVREGNLRQLIAGIAAALGIVSVLAVLSRLYPSAFPLDQVARFFPGSRARLDYPLGYANGTGNLLALGLPLLLAVATRARTIATQAVAAACLPIVVLGIVMTASRGAVVAAAVGIAIFFALAPDRLPRLATAVVAAGGSAIVVDGLLRRDAFRKGLSTPAAIAERHQMLLLALMVCAGVALLQAGIALAVKHAGCSRVLRIGHRRAVYAVLTGLLAAAAVAIGVGAPGRIAHEWSLFKQTGLAASSSNPYTRLGTVAGSHRYQYWSAALNAFESRPLTGIGPGAFEFYWAQHGSIFEFVRNAHSLYLETLAETGVVGFLLIASLLVIVLAAGVLRALRAPPLARAGLAAATATVAAFSVACGYDWMWQLPVAPAVALLLAGAILAYRDPAGRPALAGPRTRSRIRARAPRVAFALIALMAVLAIAIPYRMTSAIRASQAAMRADNPAAALADAATAQRLEPYAATPRLQRALVLEATGDLSAARAAVAQAAVREPANWQIWLIRSRIDAEAGAAVAAVRDYRQAHMLNPRSPATAL